jgi:hypothetical protein
VTRNDGLAQIGGVDMSTAQAGGIDRDRSGPVIVAVSAENASAAVALDRLVADVRAYAEAFIFLSGGASRIPEESKPRVLGLVEGSLTRLAASGLRFAVGDGGTQAGVMEAAGIARRASGNLFPLIGVAPAPHITASGEQGKTPVDPNHTVVVSVRNDGWIAARRDAGEPVQDYWGSEVPTMFRLFARLADRKPSVALIVNGGRVTLDEIRQNVDARRPIVLVAGSGRAADAVVALLRHVAPADDEARNLMMRARALELAAAADLYRVADLDDGPQPLADTLDSILRRGPVG